MTDIKYYDRANQPDSITRQSILEFLYRNLEQYGDPIDQIESAMSYALQEIESPGGYVLTVSEGDDLLGATVINRTGMSGYIPENILVYIATDSLRRGEGVGKTLMQAAIDTVDGDIALHVEKDNPARFLYEKLGFTNPYLEMRLKK